MLGIKKGCWGTRKRGCTTSDQYFRVMRESFLMRLREHSNTYLGEKVSFRFEYELNHLQTGFETKSPVYQGIAMSLERSGVSND